MASAIPCKRKASALAAPPGPSSPIVSVSPPPVAPGEAPFDIAVYEQYKRTPGGAQWLREAAVDDTPDGHAWIFNLERSLRAENKRMTDERTAKRARYLSQGTSFVDAIDVDDTPTSTGTPLNLPLAEVSILPDNTLQVDGEYTPVALDAPVARAGMAQRGSRAARASTKQKQQTPVPKGPFESQHAQGMRLPPSDPQPSTRRQSISAPVTDEAASISRNSGDMGSGASLKLSSVMANTPMASKTSQPGERCNTPIAAAARPVMITPPAPHKHPSPQLAKSSLSGTTQSTVANTMAQYMTAPDVSQGNEQATDRSTLKSSPISSDQTIISTSSSVQGQMSKATTATTLSKSSSYNNKEAVDFATAMGMNVDDAKPFMEQVGAAQQNSTLGPNPFAMMRSGTPANQQPRRVASGPSLRNGQAPAGFLSSGPQSLAPSVMKAEMQQMLHRYRGTLSPQQQHAFDSWDKGRKTAHLDRLNEKYLASLTVEQRLSWQELDAESKRYNALAFHVSRYAAQQQQQAQRTPQKATMHPMQSAAQQYPVQFPQPYATQPQAQHNSQWMVPQMQPMGPGQAHYHQQQAYLVPSQDRMQRPHTPNMATNGIGAAMPLAFDPAQSQQARMSPLPGSVPYRSPHPRRMTPGPMIQNMGMPSPRVQRPMPMQRWVQQVQQAQPMQQPIMFAPQQSYMQHQQHANLVQPSISQMDQDVLYIGSQFVDAPQNQGSHSRQAMPANWTAPTSRGQYIKQEQFMDMLHGANGWEPSVEVQPTWQTNTTTTSPAMVDLTQDALDFLKESSCAGTPEQQDHKRHRSTTPIPTPKQVFSSADYQPGKFATQPVHTVPKQILDATMVIMSMPKNGRNQLPMRAHLKCDDPKYEILHPYITKGQGFLRTDSNELMDYFMNTSLLPEKMWFHLVKSPEDTWQN